MPTIKKNIVFVIKDIKNSAGTEKATIGIANGLSEKGYNVHLAVLEKSGDPFFEVLPSVNIFEVSERNSGKKLKFKDLERRKKLRDFYKSIAPDLIVFVGSGRSLLNVPTARGYRSVTWEHFNAGINWHLLHPISKWLAARFCEKIITLTEEDAVDYHLKYGANTLCIPNFINVPDQRVSMLEEKKMIAVGRLTYQKGFDLLLPAWKKTACHLDGWKLKIIGNGKLFGQLQLQIKALGLEKSVEIEPATPKVWEELLDASVYLMSSRYEGLPLILLEAMAAGLPLVAFDCKTGPREVIDEGENGFIISNFETQSMAKAIDSLAYDEKLRNNMGKQSLIRTQRFTKEAVLKKWVSLIEEIPYKPMD